MAAFVAALALHAVPLGLFLTSGAWHGLPDGQRILQVDILNQEQASETVGDRTGGGGSPAVEPVPEPAEDAGRGRAAVASAAKAPPAAGKSGETLVVEAPDSPFEIERKGGDPGRDARSAKANARKGRTPAPGRKDRAGAPRPQAPAPRQAADRGVGEAVPTPGTGSKGGEVRRVASRGGLAERPGTMPPSWRDVLVALLQQQIERCYAAPAGAEKAVVLPVLEIRLRPDGTFSADPRIARGGASPIDKAVAQAALKAVGRCAPYRLPVRFAPYYEDWKLISAEFEFASR